MGADGRRALGRSGRVAKDRGTVAGSFGVVREPFEVRRPRRPIGQRRERLPMD
jgi:hypothetical protein